MSEKPLYADASGRWSVSRRLVKSPRIDWRASEIVAVELSRLPLFVALAVSAVISLMLTGLRPVLYAHELAIGLCIAVAIAAVGSQVAILRVSMEAMRGTETGRVVGPLWVLAGMRAAICQVISEREDR